MGTITISLAQNLPTQIDNFLTSDSHKSLTILCTDYEDLVSTQNAVILHLTNNQNQKIIITPQIKVTKKSSANYIFHSKNNPITPISYFFALLLTKR